MKQPALEVRHGASRVKRIPLLFVVLVVLGILLLFSGIARQGYGEVAAARAEKRELLREKARLEAHVLRMRAMLSALKKNPRAVESLARKELGWVRPGERTILLQKPTPIPRPKSLTGDDSAPILALPD